MTLKTYTTLKILLEHFNINCGNVLHYAVYTRNVKLFASESNDKLLNEKFDDLTPLELAKKLNYNEFFVTETCEKNDFWYFDIYIRESVFEKYINPLMGYSKRKVRMSVNNFLSVSKKITEFPIEEINVTKKENKIIVKYKKEKYKFRSRNGNEIDMWFNLLQSKEERIKECYKIIDSQRKLGNGLSHRGNDVGRRENSLSCKENDVDRRENGVDRRENDVRMNENGVRINEIDISEEDEYNPYIFMYINKILMLKIDDTKALEILSQIKPLDKYLENNQSEYLNDSSGSFYSSDSSEFYDFEDVLHNFEIHRSALPVKTRSSFEPLSFLQKITEQFQNVHTLQERDDDLVLFTDVLSFFMSSIAIFRNRTKKCFEAFVGETFSMKDKDFEVFVEKSDKNNINLISFANDIVFIMNNVDVELRIGKYLFVYKYDIRKLDAIIKSSSAKSSFTKSSTIKSSSIKSSSSNKKKEMQAFNDEREQKTLHNILNTTTSSKMYQYKNNDFNSQGNFNHTNLSLHTQNELQNFDLILHCNLEFKNSNVSGIIKRKKVSEILVKGKWNEKVIYKYLNIRKDQITWQNSANTYSMYYNFTLFTMQLNYHIKTLKSDSRNREDIRALENGDVNYSRECNEILINRERIRESEGLTFGSRFFREENGKWVFVSGNVNNNVSFGKDDVI